MNYMIYGMKKEKLLKLNGKYSATLLILRWKSATKLKKISIEEYISG